MKDGRDKAESALKPIRNNKKLLGELMTEGKGIGVPEKRTLRQGCAILSPLINELRIAEKVISDGAPDYSPDDNTYDRARQEVLQKKENLNEHIQLAPIIEYG